MKRDFNTGGFTLVEMLVVTAVFAGLAVLVSSMVLYSTRGSKKSESAVKVRAELENAIARIERDLREAKTDTVAVGSTNISFKDQNDQNVNVSCTTVSGSEKKLVMRGQDLTGSNIIITDCNFSSISGNYVTISLSGKTKGVSGVESDNVAVSAQIVLRNY